MRHILINHKIWCEAQHVSVTLLVGSPAEPEGHEEEPGTLQESHLIIKVKVSEA